MDQTLTKRTILCVQNDEEAHAWIARSLPIYDCVFATTAYDAVRNLHLRSFGAYVVGYWLPDWGGPSLCREIRKYDPHSPVLFLTRGTGENEQKRAMRAGANAYLRQPLDGAVLQNTLRSLFDEADMRSVRARAEAEHAVRDVLQRTAAQAAANSARDVGRSLERIARGRAYKAFIACGGTRAHFESWWPQAFDTTLASFEVG